MITVLAGGVGGSKFIRGLTNQVPPSSIVAVVNIGDDDEFYGLHVSPDLDTVTYVLAGLDNNVTGWGVKDETYNALSMVKRLGDAAWFTLGDRDLGTHLYRTKRLKEGAQLSEVTREISKAHNIEVDVLPFTDSSVRTMILGKEISDTKPTVEFDVQRLFSFQEYFVKHHHQIEISSIYYEGADRAILNPEVAEALASCKKVLVAPSNPLLSIGPMLAIPRLKEVLMQRRRDTIAVSPIVQGEAVKGPLQDILRDLYGDTSAVSVAKFYQPYVGTFVVDSKDSCLVKEIEALDMNCVVFDTLMTDKEAEAKLAGAVVEL